MKEMYMCPQAELVCFAPASAIAIGWNPDWGFEDNIFGDGDGASTQEIPTLGDDDNT